MLAIGIGSGLSGFSLIERTFWRPLPGVSQPEGLVALEFQTSAGTVPVSYAAIEELVSGAQSLQTVFASSHAGVNLGLEKASSRRAVCQVVTAGYFQALGAAISLGRGFTAQESNRGGDPVAVISQGLWQEAYSGRDDVLGQPVYVNGHRLGIVGVVVAGFSGVSVLDETDIWLPAGQMPTAVPFVQVFDPQGRSFFTLYGRLAEGRSPSSAAAEVQALADRVEAIMGYDDLRVVLNEDAGRPAFVGEYLRSLLRPVTLVLALVLLAAVANLAALFLARGLARRQEYALRHALGASRRRLCAHALLESLAVALLGMVAALGVAAGLFALFDRAGLLEAVPGFDRFALSWPLLLAGGVATILCGLSAGAASAWSSTKALSQGLKESSYSLARPARARNLLTVVQIASAFALLVAAGGFHRSIERLLDIDLGMDLPGLYVFSIEPRLNGYDEERCRKLYGQVKTALEARPEVTGSALIDWPPFSATLRQVRVRAIDDEPGEWQNAFRKQVSSGYFAQVGVPLIEGRDFVPHLGRETHGSGQVILTRSLAQQLWPEGGAAEGRTVEIEGGAALTVRAVAEDHRANSPFRTHPLLFEPLGQLPMPGRMSFVFRGPALAGEAEQLARREVESLEPNLAVFGAGALDARLAGSFSDRRLLAWLSALLAAAAMVLSCAGLFGTLSWSMLERRREFGIRLAIGSGRLSIASLGLRYVALLAAAGIAAGAALIWLAGQWLEARLYQVSTFEPEAVAIAVGIVLLCSLGAAAIPISRALSVDPADVLRAE
ncbi:MAG TPA: FtsX-like permease family protein [Acidobacteriota bacterium]|nr:FtsX-like permease family protein [Acidobacteriota bacterium]